MFGTARASYLSGREAQAVDARRLYRAAQFAALMFACLWLTSCAGSAHSETAQLPIAVVFPSANFAVQASQSQGFTVTVENDSANRGVTWTLSGGGCSGSSCGTLTNVAATSVTYRAPTIPPTPPAVTLTATSVADGTKSAATIITVTTSPAISVSVSPVSDSLQVSTAANFSASVQNDSQNKGVAWSLSGVGCAGAGCGTLTNITNASATYTAPAAVPTPATVSLIATSVADGTRSAAASVTITAAPPIISVSVSPTSASVQVSTRANFSVSVQNDSQNKGVTWSLSGAGCSGASCGALTNVTTTSATYIAPAAVPTPASVTLTATSISDGTKNALAVITVTQPTSVGATPGFAANHVSGSSTQGNAVSRYDFRLPNGTMSGNCVVIGFQYSVDAGVTASVSDDKGNSYSTPISHTDGNQIVNLSFALNVAAGTQRISVTFSGGTPAFVSALATEFYNVAPVNALDGSSGNDGTGPSVSAGTFTPSNGGDLIYQYAVQDSSSNPMISWSQGSTPWVLLSSDVLDGSASQYQVQNSAAPLSPVLGMAPAQNFASVAIALKAASAGSPPPPGIRVVRVQHHAVQPFASSPLQLQFPCTGNLIVLAWIGVPLHDITGVKDGNGNSYVSPGPAFGLGLSGDSQIYYAPSASTSSMMTGPTFTTTGTDISGSTAVLFDVSGAATSPYDATAGMPEASGVQTNPGNVSAVTISPSTAKGLVISTLGVDSNTIDGVSLGDFLSAVPTPVASPNPVDQNNGWALWYNASPGAGTFVWSSQGGAVQDWSSIAVAFKAAP